jgi:DNA polymerase-3 subunit beta
MRVINGNFPDYRQLFPKEYNFSFELNKSEIIKTLQITNILTTQYNFCEFNLDIQSKKINIKAVEKSVGNVKKTLAYKDVSGEIQDFSVNYNSIYFLEGLQKMDGQSVVLKYTATNKPMFLESNNDLSFKYLLMPLNR